MINNIRRRGMGRLHQRYPQPGPNLRGEQGGTHLPIFWETRAGGAAHCNCKSIQEAAQHLHRKGADSMPNFSIGVITPQARDAARRREVTGRLELQFR